MSDTATYEGVRRVTRVRMLGDAVPNFRPFRDEPDEKIVPKTADELRADRDAARDDAPMSTSCGTPQPRSRLAEIIRTQQQVYTPMEFGW